MNKTLEGNLRTIANCKDEGWILLRFKDVKEIVELIKENDELRAFIQYERLHGEFYGWLDWHRAKSGLNYKDWKEQSENENS